MKARSRTYSHLQSSPAQRNFLELFRTFAQNSPCSDGLVIIMGSAAEGGVADILLGRQELEQGALPGVCVVCGAEQATPVKTKLHVIVAENPLITTLRVHDGWLPCCPRHQWHFYRRQIHIFAGALCMAMFLPCMGLTALVLGPFLRETSFGWVFAIVALVLPFVVGLVIMYKGRSGNVQARDITDEGVLMMNLSERFVDAVKAARTRKGT